MVWCFSQRTREFNQQKWSNMELKQRGLITDPSKLKTVISLLRNENGIERECLANSRIAGGYHRHTGPVLETSQGQSWNSHHLPSLDLSNSTPRGDGDEFSRTYLNPVVPCATILWLVMGTYQSIHKYICKWICICQKVLFIIVTIIVATITIIVITITIIVIIITIIVIIEITIIIITYFLNTLL